MFSKVNDSLMVNILKNHQAIYNLDLDIKNNEEMPFEYFMYGHACGFGGNIPDKRFKLYSLEYKEIARWLRSMNPEIQAYGLYGMYKLYNEGYKISIEDVKIMEHLISIKISLNACSGCSVGIDKTFSDIVSEKQLKKLKRKMKIK